MGFLLSTKGRAGRKDLALYLLAVIVVGTVINRTLGPASIAAFAFAILFFWPTYVALPVRRFHDMNRSWRYVAGFGGAIVFSLAFIAWDLHVRAPLVDMTAWQAFSNAEEYVARMEALAADVDDENAKRALPLSATGWGGFSLFLIFAAIAGAWALFIPGTEGDNRYGPDPRTVT